MRLLAHLLVRILAVVALCLTLTTGWTLFEAKRGIDAAISTSADRAVLHLEKVYWQALIWRDGLGSAPLLPQPEWLTLGTSRIIAPGVCLEFAASSHDPQRLCSEAEGVYAPAPSWFAALYHRAFGAFPTASRRIGAHQRKPAQIIVGADPETALRLAWMQIGLMVEVAAIMAAAIGLLTAAFVTRALLPVRAIIDGLRRLEDGDTGHRIARRGVAELGLISTAVDALAARLAETDAARAALTRQLFHVQEEERRALARDLHDEFGQCLAATAALAASIEAGAADRPDLVADSRAIADVARRMMGTLKDALVRLRSQDIDELGFESCLRQLAARWNAKPGALVELRTAGDLHGLPRPLAIGLFRIAQECLTNAAKHGDPRKITLSVDAGTTAGVALSVEDDGGGDPARAATGHGLVGIRERIAALGGSLAIERAAAGFRVAATIPYAVGTLAPA